MVGDISPLELFLMSILFIYLKSVETNVCRNKFKVKVKRISKFIFDCFDTWVIVIVLNFFSTI